MGAELKTFVLGMEKDNRQAMEAADYIRHLHEKQTCSLDCRETELVGFSLTSGSTPVRLRDQKLHNFWRAPVCCGEAVFQRCEK